MECMDYLACMYMFDVLRKCHTLFLKWLYYCKQVAFGTASLLFLVVSTLLSVWEYFTGIIIQISLKTMMLIIFSCSTYFHLYIMFIEVCVQIISSFIYLGFILFLIFFIVVQVQLSLFTPTTPHHPSHLYLLPLILSHFGFAHVYFIHVPWQPSPFFLPLSPPTFPLVIVSFFLISLSLVIFCILVCFVD